MLNKQQVERHVQQSPTQFAFQVNTTQIEYNKWHKEKMDYPVNFSNSKDSTETFLNELVKHPAMSAITNTAKNEE